MENRWDSSPNLPDLSEYPEILKPKHVARILAISNDRVYRLFHSCDFPSVTTGRTGLCIPKARLIRWLQEPVAGSRD